MVDVDHDHQSLNHLDQYKHLVNSLIKHSKSKIFKQLWKDIERMSVLPNNRESLFDFTSNELNFNDNQKNLFGQTNFKQDIQLMHCLHLWNIFGYLIKVNNEYKWDKNWMIKEIESKLAKYYKMKIDKLNSAKIKGCIRYLFESREFGDIKVFEFILDFRYFIIQTNFVSVLP